MSDAESKPLLDWLREHARPVLCYRFRRQPGSLAFRDNRCIRHHPVDDNRGERRVKHRVTIYGDTPFRMRGAADSAPHPFPSQERRMPAPAPGVPAPEFTLPNQDGKLVSLSDHAGKPVLVWFFSRAFGSN
jgi:peroxiredoxin Q/BCP